jgi:hypothetical protein
MAQILFLGSNMATVQQNALKTEQLHRQMMVNEHRMQDELYNLDIAKHSPLISQTTQKLLMRIKLLKLFVRLLSKFNATERRMWFEKAFSGFSRIILRRKESKTAGMEQVAVKRAPNTTVGRNSAVRPSARS